MPGVINRLTSAKSSDTKVKVGATGYATNLFLESPELAVAIIGIALFIFFTVASPNFATTADAVTLSQYASPIIILAVAEVFLLILGEIDLSVGEVYVLSPFIVYFSAQAGLGVIVGIILAIVTSCLVGALNGFVTVKLRVPSFITTLGSAFAIEGIVLISSSGMQESTVGTGALSQVLGGWSWAELIWALGAVAAFHVVLRHTTFGLHTLASGGNRVSARETGIKIGSIKIRCFVVCSLLGGLLGLLDSYRYATIDPGTDGLSLMFYGVAAAVVGGTALTGGRGTVLGAFIGGIVLGILQDGFNILGVNAFAYDLVLGLAIVGAMILNVRLEDIRTSSAEKRRQIIRLAHSTQGNFSDNQRV